MQHQPTPTLLPGSTPHAATSLSPRSSRWQELRHFWGQVRFVALYEILLQLRSIGYWILLLVLSLLTGVIAFSQISTLYNYVSDGQTAVTVASNEVTYFCCLLPFLFLNVFQRDKWRNVHTLLWTQPITSFTYALGKSIAATLISFLVIWPPLLIGWIVASVTRGSMQPLEPWLIVLLINSAVAVLIALISLLCITLIPLPLLGAFVPAGISTYLNVVQAKSMILLQNLTESSLFISPTVNLGPDTSFTVWQRLSYMCYALLALGLLLLVYQLYQRRGIARLRHYLVATLLIVLAIALLIPSMNSFQASVVSAQDLGSMSTPLSSAQTSQYTLDGQADPTTGQIQATASFQLTTSTSTNNVFYMVMSPGLQVEQVTAKSADDARAQTLPFTQQYGWTALQLQHTELQPARDMTIHVTYAGHISIGRDYYASAIPGWGRGNDVSTTQNYFYLSYLGQGAGMLQGGAGSWYPLPWTKQAVVNYGTRIPIDSLHLRVPSSVSMYTAGETKSVTSADGQWQELNLTPHTSLPVAFVAFLQHPQSTAINGSTVWYQGSTPDPAQVYSDDSIIQSLNTLEQWLSTPNNPATTQIVRVPLLTRPFIGQGLLLLPETPVGDSSLPFTPVTTRHMAATEMAQAWWLNNTIVPFELDSGGADLQIPYPSSGLNPNSNAYAMISSYSSMVVADKMMGNHFQSNEANICQEAYQATQPSATQPLQTQSTVERDLISIGVPYCTYAELALYHLQQKIGLPEVSRLLQTYAIQHAKKAIGTRDFLMQASAIAGNNLIPTAAPYICSGRVSVDKGASDPLSCLTEAGQQ